MYARSTEPVVLLRRRREDGITSGPPTRPHRGMRKRTTVENSGTDDPFPPQRAPRPAPSRAQRHNPEAAPPPPPRADLFRRRLIALLVGAGILVIMIFLVRGCLDARKERSFENYLRDLSSIITTSQQLSTGLFQRINDPQDASKEEFTNQLGAARGTGEDLLRRVEGLDPPEELADAQSDLIAAFTLRRDALADIAEQAPTALDDSGRLEALQAMAADMRAFLASDVLYARAEAEIERIVAEQAVEVDNPDDPLPASQFLPEPPEQYIDVTQLAGLLAAVAADTGAADAGAGTELSSTVLLPGNVPLSPDTLTTFSPRGAATEVEVSVLNGGTEDVVDVLVSYEISGGLTPISGEGTIARIDPGESGTVRLPITGELTTGQEQTLTVTVLPVPGETIVDNNESIYPVIFE